MTADKEKLMFDLHFEGITSLILFEHYIPAIIGVSIM